MSRFSVIVYKSVYEAIQLLPDEEQLKAYNAILEYAFTGNMPELSGAAGAVFLLVKPQIDANNKRFVNGGKGGRPAGETEETETEAEPNENQSITETKPNPNQTITKTKPNPNLRTNDYNKDKSSNNKDDDNAHASARAVAVVLPKVKQDCRPCHTAAEYRQAADALRCSDWASANFTHLSKLHRHWEKLLGGYYREKGGTDARSGSGRTASVVDLNAIFADFMPEDM